MAKSGIRSERAGVARRCLAGVAALVALLASGMVGCASPASTQGASPAAPVPAATSTSAPAPTPVPEASVMVVPTETPAPPPGPNPNDGAVLAVWDQYWAAQIQAFNFSDSSPALWEPFADQASVLRYTTRVNEYRAKRVNFSGAPLVGPATVTWEGEVATVSGCIDITGWVMTEDGYPGYPDTDPLYTKQFQVELIDGTWRMNGKITNFNSPCSMP